MLWAAALVALVVVLVPASVARAGGPPPVAIATGMDSGWPDVRGFTRDGVSASLIAPWSGTFQFSPYSTYQYGVRVAVGDVNGDGRPEIVTAPAKGGWTEIRVFDGTTHRQLAAMPPYAGAGWWNGAYVTTGDVNGDGRAEVVDGLDAGCCTTLHVLDGVTGAETAGFFPYGPSTQSGARVAVADLNGDGRAEILSVPLGGTQVSAFGTTGGDPFRVYPTFGPEAIGGVAIATGDVTGDATPELVASARTAAGVSVKVVDVRTGEVLAALRPFDNAVATPEVAVGDVDGNGRADVVVLAQVPGGTQVKEVDVTGRELATFFVLDPDVAPAPSLAAGDLDGDGRAEIVLGSGPNTALPWPPVSNGPDQHVAVYSADGRFVAKLSAYPGVFQGGVRVAVVDAERDGRPEIVTAPGPGMPPEIGVFSQRWRSSQALGTRVARFLAYEQAFTGGVSVAAGYWDGTPRIVVAPGGGRAPEVRLLDTKGNLLSSFLALDPGYTGGLSVAAGDLDADGLPEIVVGTLASPARVRAFRADGTPFGPLIAPFVPGGHGVEVAVADRSGTGRGAIVAAASGGADPLLLVLDPRSGAVLGQAHPIPDAENGLRVGTADLDLDGRDDVLVAPAWAPSGASGRIYVLDGRLRVNLMNQIYDWAGAGMNVAGAPRIGLPLRAGGVRLVLRRTVRASAVVARFRDAGPAPAASRLRATIDWGDGTSARGTALRRDAHAIDVRGTKRYARAGVYQVAVTLTDTKGRIAIAASTAVVRR